MKTNLIPFLEGNLYKFFEDFVGFEDYSFKRSKQYDYIFSHRYQWPGYVYNIRTKLESCNKLVNELGRKITKEKIPSFLLVDRKRVSQDFDEQLNQIGIRKIDFWPVIFLNLEKNKLTLRHPAHFTIHKINDENELIIWYNIVIKILFPTKSTPFNFFRARLYDSRYFFYLGYYYDLPVTTCMFFINSNIAGAYMGATLKDYRGKGFGKEIVVNGLLDSASAGCVFATAQSSRFEYPVWEKLGFSITNTIDIYWKLEN